MTRSEEISKGRGTGLQPDALFLSSPDRAPLPISTGGAGEEVYEV
jgi:hypothetical protein